MNGRVTDTLIPLGLVIGLHAAAIGVITRGYLGDFHTDVRFPAEETIDRAGEVETILHHALQTDVHQALASVLAASHNERLLRRSVRRVAYLILSNTVLTRSGAATTFAARAPVRFASGQTSKGFEAASRRLFGLPSSRLSIGELALLCRTAVTGHLPPAPDEALRVRNRLIDRLESRGVLSRADVDREHARPLTLAPDPSPIY